MNIAVDIPSCRTPTPEGEEDEGGDTDGLSLPQAILRRYNYNVDDRVCRIICPESPTGKKVGNMVIPRVIALDGNEVTHAGDIEQIRELCSHVKELHLPCNKITHWDDVHHILANMPYLTFLNLTSNHLHQHLTVDPQPYERLSRLILNGTMASWLLINHMLPHLPNLEDLHLSMNGYRSIDLAEGVRSEKMKTLYFNGNPVGDWSQVLKLGRAFTNLDTLFMEDSEIHTIGDVDDLSAHFSHLEQIDLAGSKISSWDEIDKFNHLPLMTILRLKRNALFEEYGESLSRQLCIARLPKVVKMNGSVVTGNERDDAERVFLRHYLDAAESDKPQRYHELQAQHGKLDPLAEVNLTPKTHVQVRVIYNNQVEEKVIDLYQTVLQLKQTLKDFTGLPVSKMMLYYVDVEYIQCYGPEEMKYNQKKLYTYGIHEYDHILIADKNV